MIAIGMYEEATRLDPAFAQAWSRLAHAHAWRYQWYFDRSESRLRQAREAVTRALALDPHLADAHYALGRILVDENEPERAMEEFRDVLRHEPNHAEALYGLSHAAISQGDWDVGRRYAVQAMELSPTSAALACWTGGAHSYAGDYHGAMEHHQTAVKLAPDRACHYFCEVEALLNWDGETRRARAFLERVPAHLDREKSPALDYQWILVEMIDGRWDEALRRIAAGRAAALQSPWFYMPRTLLAAQVNDLRVEPDLARAGYEESVSTIEGLLEARPLDARLHGALGMAYAGLGRRSEAVEAAQRGIDLLGDGKTDLPYRLRDLAIVHALLGEHTQALATLERLLELRTGFFSPAYLRAEPLLRDLERDPRFATLLDRPREAA
ncbi:MAG TPA: tetratricopeptide repeat protein [Thermoanaerobaculia bacterium]|nr:tetratricopeptide repeat protein [Thermoanaerobaculia bacterium]